MNPNAMFLLVPFMKFLKRNSCFVFPEETGSLGGVFGTARLQRNVTVALICGCQGSISTDVNRVRFLLIAGRFGNDISISPLTSMYIIAHVNVYRKCANSLFAFFKKANRPFCEAICFSCIPDYRTGLFFFCAFRLIGMASSS